ncbi:hypothetical protein JY651_43830 [Pyxidicoccus parkwayensis]|uniref:Lipoprotein n=1 Tax=Pyxidicoccus parkwayensis TaxID=2813578 RepID=A0ABX7NSY2_9BACT|nr:hypothetical protein [Pyxidicoccus parkwaysis]QSQ22005.1 hypothetical protein JY651_43830 [Pyxidicoccus parkwaysis]
MSLRHLLSVLVCGLALAACESTVEVPDDAEACAGYQCTAGECFSNAGQPMCRCGAWEAAAGVQCAVGAFETQDEFGGSPGSAEVLTLPMAARTAELQVGRREEVRDRDLFAFTAVPDHAYAFYCGLLTLRECTLRLLDASGRPAALSVGTQVDGSNGVRYGVFKADTAGPWYVEVSSDRYEGTYTYQLEDLGADDHGDTFSEATPLQAYREPPPFSVMHSTPTDADVFTFHAVAGHGYRFSCEHPGASYPVLRMTDGRGQLVDGLQQSTSGRAAALAMATVTTDWYVEVRASSGPFPLLSLCRLEDLGVDEHSDQVEGATPVLLDAPVSVTFQSRSDIDVLTFTAERGHVYLLHADGAGAESCDVGVVDIQGRQMFALGSSLSLTFEPPEPGRYAVMLMRPSAWMPTFLFTVEDLGADDHGDTPATATFIAWGDSVSGRFETPTDTDAIAFPAQAGHVYLAECEPACDMGRDLSGPAPAPFARLGPGQYLVRAQRTEPLALLLRSLGGSNSFTLRLQDVATDDYGGSSSDAEPLMLPASVSGILHTVVDEDVFTVHLMVLHRYRLATNLGSLQLSVALSGGGLATFPQDGLFSVGTSGTYLIRVFGASGLSRPAWSFTLREE